MKLGNFKLDGKSFAGAVLDQQHILNLSEAANIEKRRNRSDFASMDNIIRSNRLDEVQIILDQKTKGSKDQVGSNEKNLIYHVDDVEFLTPILHPGKLILAAVNYVAHGNEGNISVPEKPYFFTKFPDCLVPHNGDVIAPRISDQTDYEAELAVVIGREGKYITREDAMDYVAGYTVVNDVSFRDYQLGNRGSKNQDLGMDWVKGKALDTACPIGPYLVTRDEVMDPYKLKINMYVNGDKRQEDIAGSMIFKIDQLIEYLSNGITLRPGDIISTGTPAGVGAFNGNRYLGDGDMLETVVEGIGILKNRVVKEK